MESSNLFKPLQIGNLKLENRIVMAPLTRYRADINHVPHPFVAEHYAQRASTPGTFIIAEATFVSPEAGGGDYAPGIWNKEQINSWKNVTKAVHDKKCFIFLQLWAHGRVAVLEALKRDLGENAKVVSASNIGVANRTPPTPLTEEEIQKFIRDFAQAAKNAIEAGFDGVEIHSAHGYLLDQFIQDVSNDRTDSWGGSIENRARFSIEVTKAVVKAIGPERTGIRISPFSTYQEMGMKEPKPQFSYLAREFKKLNLAYLHAVAIRNSGLVDGSTGKIGLAGERSGNLEFLMDIWGDQNPFLIAGGYTAASAKKTVDVDHPEKKMAVVFGRHFISNPDLVFRIRHGIEFTPYNRCTFYLPEEKTEYITYPFCKEYLAQMRKEKMAKRIQKL